MKERAVQDTATSGLPRANLLKIHYIGKTAAATAGLSVTHWPSPDLVN